MKNTHVTLLKCLLLVALGAAMTACGGGRVDGSSHSESDDDEDVGLATSTKAATNAVAGQALYVAYCANCHGASFASARNYASTLSAIARDKGGMGTLSASIQTAQANDIATYLSNGVGTSSASQLLAQQSISFAAPGSQMLGATPTPLSASASSAMV